MTIRCVVRCTMSVVRLRTLYDVYDKMYDVLYNVYDVLYGVRRCTMLYDVCCTLYDVQRACTPSIIVSELHDIYTNALALM